MKINFPPVARRLWGRSAMLLTIVAALLLSGCVAPYGYEGYSRYRAGGYGYWVIRATATKAAITPDRFGMGAWAMDWAATVGSTAGAITITARRIEE